MLGRYILCTLFVFSIKYHGGTSVHQGACGSCDKYVTWWNFWN